YASESILIISLISLGMLFSLLLDALLFFGSISSRWVCHLSPYVFLMGRKKILLNFRGNNAKEPEYFEDLFCNLGCYEE
ncbi:hypothetical protein K8353_50505, partial [Burkholderia contaminans]|nr:hypothetical protein [Burkholderia contaminans]